VLQFRSVLFLMTSLLWRSDNMTYIRGPIKHQTIKLLFFLIFMHNVGLSPSVDQCISFCVKQSKLTIYPRRNNYKSGNR